MPELFKIEIQTVLPFLINQIILIYAKIGKTRYKSGVSDIYKAFTQNYSIIIEKFILKALIKITLNLVCELNPNKTFGRIKFQFLSLYILSF